MQPIVILQVLILVFVANGTPVVAKKVWGGHLSYPVDGGLRFMDGRRVLGPSKTVRGLFVSILLTSACAPLIGLDWNIGAVIACAAMAGDLFSSFVKRRQRLPASAQAIGLDQVPESLFPLLACQSMLALTVVDIVVGVVLFFMGERILSRLLYRLRQ
ncbi:MAG: CDP-archaeol synthase [Hyphomicrobiales bacterium]|nr:CDP-archaeol synthase [Hyphomicrobiales bacterium]